MPTGLQAFVSDPAAQGAPLRIPATGKKLPKSNYIGMALVPKNLLPDIGSATTFTPPPSGTAAPVTVFNICSILAALAFNGQAWVFGNGVINGKRGKFKEDMEKVVFGSRRSPRPTGEGEETLDLTFKHYYLNRAYFNQLRYNFGEYDIYMFTDRSVETYRYDLAEPVFVNLSDEVSGDNGEEILGGFQIVVGTDGQVDPDFIPGSSAFEQPLSISNFKFSFATPVAAGGLTASLSATQFNMASGTGGTIALTVNQSVGAGVVSYGVYADDGSAAPAGVTINSSTGLVTVANSLAVGQYKLKVLAQNAVGVLGERAFKVVCA